MDLVINCGGLGCGNAAELVTRIVINGIAMTVPTCPTCGGNQVSISAEPYATTLVDDGVVVVSEGA